MYPRNAASPERISIGAVVQISDGSVQSSGVDVKVIPFGGSESSGAGTVAYSADGVVLYTPTQGETDYTSFILVASKTGCIPATVTVVTSASVTAGYAGVDWGKVTDKTATVALTNTTISTSQAVASVSGSVGSVTGNVGGNVVGSVGSVVSGVTVTTNNDKTGYTLAVTPPTAATIADAVWDEDLSGHLTAGSTGKTLDIIKRANLTIEGTVAASPAPTTTTFNLTGADYPTGAMEHSVLFFEEGTANIELENSPISTWTNNGDGTVTVVLEEPLTAAPQAGDIALILPQSHVHSVAAIQAGLALATELAKVPKSGESYRYTQLASNTGNKTADVSIGAIP